MLQQLGVITAEEVRAIPGPLSDAPPSLALGDLVPLAPSGTSTHVCIPHYRHRQMYNTK